MEDAHSIVLALPGHGDTAVFGVFDGHGGEAVSRMLAKELPKSVARLRDPHEPKELRRACLELDEQVLKHVFSDDGSAAVFAIASRVRSGPGAHASPAPTPPSSPQLPHAPGAP